MVLVRKTFTNVWCQADQLCLYCVVVCRCLLLVVCEAVEVVGFPGV